MSRTRPEQDQKKAGVVCATDLLTSLRQMGGCIFEDLASSFDAGGRLFHGLV